MTEDEPSPALLIEGFLAQTREYGIICISPAGRITAWLGAAGLIFGYEEVDVIGKPAGLLFTSHDRDKGIDVQELDVARIDSRSEDDRWHVRKDGSRIWVSGSVQAVRNSSGDLIGFVKVVRDRTDLQARIERNQRHIEGCEAAARRTHAFLRTLGHELRNPLTPLLNSAFILRRVSDDARIHKAAGVIEGQVAGLRRMADDLMDVARLDVGQVRLHRQRTDLKQLVHDACAGFQGAAAAKGVTLSNVLPAGSLMADVDLERMHQVIQNLLTNAIKYTPTGGKVWVKATQEFAEIVIRVEDTGAGISAEMLPKLFDLFTRDDSARDMDPGGLGVGLAVVKAVMELHGGTVQARSPGVGKGSEFAVRFPAAPDDRDSPTPGN
jgi:two-component system CheB/CheR fusion protein